MSVHISISSYRMEQYFCKLYFLFSNCTIHRICGELVQFGMFHSLVIAFIGAPQGLRVGLQVVSSINPCSRLEPLFMFSYS
jgi:hypothetical protein